MVVETSYPWRTGGWEGMAPDRNAMTWPVSPTGQARFLRGRWSKPWPRSPADGAPGVVWWYPEAIAGPALFIWGGGSLALFGAGGELLPAAAELGGN